ncbi:hypothetical protein AB0D80_10035 [Streptomyces tendae]|uniref:hypothetical protein n=1 Tax=Streptomyces tendae TaxID=1932 RepID=UPI0033C9C8C9
MVQQIIAKCITVCPAVSPHWQMLPLSFGEERANAMFDLARQMADAGVRLIAGTDAGVQRAGFDGLVPALSFYSHLGLSPATYRRAHHAPEPERRSQPTLPGIAGNLNHCNAASGESVPCASVR